MTDSANNPLIDDADQAPAGLISMFMYVLSAEEQQNKKEDTLVITNTFEGTKTDLKRVESTNIN